MFKIKRNAQEEGAPKGCGAADQPDIIKTLNSSTSAKLTLKRSPIRAVYFRAASAEEAETKPGEKMKRIDGAEEGPENGEHLQMKDRIFSLSSTTVSHNRNVITFLASICCLCFLIVHVTDAHFSPMGNTNQNSQYNKLIPPEIRIMPLGNNQPGVQPGMQSLVTPSSLQARSDGRSVSIDRFDSGEQIRPPLLGQPTTLAPSSKSQQVSSYKQGNYNMEASASDSYITPEDRDQIMRQQENHYEGRDTDKSSYQQGDNVAPSSYSKTAGSPKLDSSSSADAEDQAQPALENRSLQPDATNVGDSDDPDYDQDEESDQKQQQFQKKGARARGGTGSGNKKQAANSNSETRRTMHGNDNSDDSEPNDDFGGVNDDAYFSRQPHSGSEFNALNHAASQHQNRGSSGGRSNDRSNANNYNSYNEGASEQAKQQPASGADEGQGFGPGPNEAYLADQAESGASGKAALDSDDDAEGSSVNDMDEGKMDRRSSKDAKLSPIGTGETASAAAPPQDSFGGDDDSDADEAADSSDDSFAASLNTPGGSSQPGSQTTVDRASASAVTPAVATAASSTDQVRSNPSSIGVSQAFGAINSQRNTPMKPTLPLFGIQRQQQPAAAPASSQQYMQQSSQQQHQQVAAGLGNQQQLASSIGTKHYHKSAFNAAYNPQNNPSHIGKFFIN